jgi:hypothetical protein
LKKKKTGKTKINKVSVPAKKSAGEKNMINSDVKYKG